MSGEPFWPFALHGNDLTSNQKSFQHLGLTENSPPWFLWTANVFKVLLGSFSQRFPHEDKPKDRFMLLEAIFWCKNTQLFILFIILLPCTKMPRSISFVGNAWRTEAVSEVTLIHPSALNIGFGVVSTTYSILVLVLDLPWEILVMLKVQSIWSFLCIFLKLAHLR